MIGSGSSIVQLVHLYYTLSVIFFDTINPYVNFHFIVIIYDEQIR